MPTTIPRAHVCTTLPPGTLPMRDKFPEIIHEGMLTLHSECGRIRRAFHRQFASSYPHSPIGTWWPYEERTDDQGEAWIRLDREVHYVVDDFGFLARVNGKGGAPC